MATLYQRVFFAMHRLPAKICLTLKKTALLRYFHL